MKDLSIYFRPVSLEREFTRESLGEIVRIHREDDFPELEKKSVAILYVPEFRNGEAALQGRSDDRFRTHLYDLFVGAGWTKPLFDLGDVLPGETPEDTYFAIRQITAELVKNSILPIVIGGSQDLSFAMYQGYEELEMMVNAMSLDYKTDLGDPDSPLSANAYVNKMLMHRPCFLFNYSLLGFQTPFVRQSELELFDKLYFDLVRLGEFSADPRVAEPLLRNADFLSIDLQALKRGEFGGKYYQNPNGFTNFELCQLARYAGISDKLTSLGIFNLLPVDLQESAHAQVAQIIWYFLDGVAQRVGDFPVGTKKDYTKFTVFLDELDHELIFMRSNKSERWWMEVPYPPKDGVKFERHHLVPCNKTDYEFALQGEIPDLWWKTYQKLG